MTYKTVNGIAE